jgi:hypothetical protein
VSVPKGIMVVQSDPVDAAREDEYNDWYDNTHVPEICAVPGFVSARRYKVHGAAAGDTGSPSYLAIYEIDADELTAPAAELRARSEAGRTHGSDALRRDPPPIVTIYELLGDPRLSG